jgi:hypothetical protein
MPPENNKTKNLCMPIAHASVKDFARRPTRFFAACSAWQPMACSAFSL